MRRDSLCAVGELLRALLERRSWHRFRRAPARARESALGIDGVTESIRYTAGVGARPAGVEWAPWESIPYGRRVQLLAGMRREASRSRDHHHSVARSSSKA